MKQNNEITVKMQQKNVSGYVIENKETLKRMELITTMLLVLNGTKH